MLVIKMNENKIIENADREIGQYGYAKIFANDWDEVHNLLKFLMEKYICTVMDNRMNLVFKEGSFFIHLKNK